MVKLLTIDVTCHMPHNTVSDIIMHVTLLTIIDAMVGAQLKEVGV